MQRNQNTNSFGYMSRYVIIYSGNCNGWGIRYFLCLALDKSINFSGIQCLPML